MASFKSSHSQGQIVSKRSVKHSVAFAAYLLFVLSLDVSNGSLIFLTGLALHIERNSFSFDRRSTPDTDASEA